MTRDNYYLNDFLSVWKNRDVSRNNLFTADISFPNDFNFNLSGTDWKDLVSVSIQNIHMTEKTVETTYNHMAGLPRQTPIIYNYNQSIPLLFKCDANFDLYSYFNQWMNYIIDESNNQISFLDDVIGSFQIHQLNYQNEILHTWRFTDPYPIRLSDVEYSDDLNRYTHFSTTIAFRKIIPNYIAKNKFGNTLSVPLVD